jgi:hypothetical protein
MAADDRNLTFCLAGSYLKQPLDFVPLLGHNSVQDVQRGLSTTQKCVI